VNWEQTKGKWNQTKGAVVKKQWGKLTDDDLTVIAGQRDQPRRRKNQSYFVRQWEELCYPTR
jgi:hypothetical protein